MSLLANIVRGLRGNLSQPEFAKKVGFSNRTITKIEAGDRPKWLNILKIIKTLHLADTERANLVRSWVRAVLGEKEFALMMNPEINAAPPKLDMLEELSRTAANLRTADQKELLLACGRPTVLMFLSACNRVYEDPNRDLQQKQNRLAAVEPTDDLTVEKPGESSATIRNGEEEQDPSAELMKRTGHPKATQPTMISDDVHQSHPKQTTSVKAEKGEDVARSAARAGSSEILGYNMEAAARLCGMSRWTLLRDTKLGKVRRTSHGIYPLEELQRYLRDDLVNNPAAPAKATTAPVATKEGRPKEKERFVL